MTTTHLLDVNVLIALVDPDHVQHETAHDWFTASGGESWATCPMTENALLRILGHPRYPNSLGTPAAVVPHLSALRRSSGHVFWPDDVGLLDAKLVRADKLSTHAQVADTYLLALAAAHRGKLATFDRRLVTTAVVGGPQSLAVI